MYSSPVVQPPHQQAAIQINVSTSNKRRVFFKTELACCLSSGLPKQHGELRACWRRTKTCENVWRNPRSLRWRAAGRSVLCAGQRCGRGPVLRPVLRRRLWAAVSAVLVSGHEHAPETRRPAASVLEQEEDRYTGGAGGRAAQILREVT